MARYVPKRWIRNASDEAAVRAGCYFDEVLAERPITFIERFCRQSKGRWAGEPLYLLDWQKDLTRRLFGWRKADGTRRFRRLYCEVAKKNGKSTWLSGLNLYLLVADGEKAPEIYLNAVNREQAQIIFEECERMVKASPELSARLTVIPSKGVIVDENNYGKIQKNSAELSSKDGPSASSWTFDEVHRYRNREKHDVFRYAGAARLNPLELNITTAGEDENGVWFELREYSEKVEAGVVEDITHLGVIYRAEETDDLDDPRTWEKANPSLGKTLSYDDFKSDLEEAKQAPQRLANFKRLRLNIITRSNEKFFNLDRWKACGAPLRDLARRPCFGGLDLSSTSDLTAYALVFPTPLDATYDVLVRFWAPENGVLKRSRFDRVPYDMWAAQGYLTLTPGDVVDYSFVEKQILQDMLDFDVQSIFVDPYNATQLCLDLVAKGVPIEFLRQGFLSLSGPTKELERLYLSGRLRHNADPVLTWCISNAVADKDAAGNVKLSKSRSREKIDGGAALVNAIAAAISKPIAPRSVYETRGLIRL